jgi:predicted RNA-binding protein
MLLYEDGLDVIVLAQIMSRMTREVKTQVDNANSKLTNRVRIRKISEVEHLHFSLALCRFRPNVKNA